MRREKFRKGSNNIPSQLTFHCRPPHSFTDTHAAGRHTPLSISARSAVQTHEHTVRDGDADAGFRNKAEFVCECACVW